MNRQSLQLHCGPTDSWCAAILFPSLSILFSCTAEVPQSEAGPAEVREASGIVRWENTLLIASDASRGRYYQYTLQPGDSAKGSGFVLAELTIDRVNVMEKPLPAPFLSDLEGIGVLARGHVAVLSERSRALFSQTGLLAVYPEPFSEVGNRGLEGLSIRHEADTSVVAALWEGGFLEEWKTPDRIKRIPGMLSQAFDPVVCIHRVTDAARRDGTMSEPCEDEGERIQLRVPAPPDATQRFRAPALVWNENGDGFLVLLSSQSSTLEEEITYKYKWLQRFDLQGNALGHALNLCDVLPASVKGGREGNLEGMSWFDEFESVILINDHKEPATAVILNVTLQWDSSDLTTSCES